MGWKLAVVGFIPLPFVFVAAWLNVVLLERYEASLQKPLEAASAFAGENVDNIKVTTYFYIFFPELTQPLDGSCLRARKCGLGSL